MVGNERKEAQIDRIAEVVSGLAVADEHAGQRADRILAELFYSKGLRSIQEVDIPTPLDDLAEKIHTAQVAKGFWPEGERNFGEAIALMTSELSEALEEHRGGMDAVYYAGLPPVPASLAVEFSSGEEATRAWERQHEGQPRKPEGVAVELADAVIRILDYLGMMRERGMIEITLDELFDLKNRYNAGRPHMHGRKY